MRHFHRFARRAVTRRSAASCCGILMVLAGCNRDPVGLTGSEVYRITDGTCGEVQFVEKLGVDQDGAAPRAEFYAVRVLDTDTQLLAHSVAEVLTTEGDLFSLEWCPD